MKTVKLWLLALLSGLLLAASCKKDQPEPDPDKEKAPLLTRNINKFIKYVMDDVYLWYKEMPKDIDINYEFDSKEYFDKLLYEEDKWSFVTDNIAEYEASSKGEEKSYGYSLAFGRFSNQPENLFAIVEYVYPDTPASAAGFQRGDIIVRMNSGNITEKNYMDLLGSASISITKGVLTENGIAMGEVVNMTGRDLVLNPVLITKIIERGTNKIGYLFYAQFIHQFNNKLDEAFQFFKNENITDLVLDLRYNPGGTTIAAQHLCSSVAPLGVVNQKKPLVTFQWNDKYMDYWKQSNNQAQLVLPFVSNVPVKLGLERIYILTTSGTASASELTIIGLEPYMNVIAIGNNTYGKYTGSITLKPEDFIRDGKGNGLFNNAVEYRDFNTWGVQPIIMRYANANAVTNFKNGVTPKYKIDDELLPAFPLGDISEPLLAKAIEDITGEPVVALKRAQIERPYEIFDRGFSKFDDFKRNMPVNDILDREGRFPLLSPISD